MKFSAWMSGWSLPCCCLLGSVFVVSEGPVRDRAEPGQGGAHRHRARPALQGAAGRNGAGLRQAACRSWPPSPSATSPPRRRTSASTSSRSARSRTCATSTAPPAATSRSPRSAWRRSSRTPCATRSTRARCRKWCPAIATRSWQAQLVGINKGAAVLGHQDLRHPHQAHRPADRRRGDPAGVPAHERAAQAGRQPVARRGRGAVADHPVRGRPPAGGDRRRGRTRCAEAARRGRCRGRAHLCRGGQSRPGFYAFQRSLEAYRRAFASGDSVIVLDRNDPFLQYLKSDR